MWLSTNEDSKQKDVPYLPNSLSLFFPKQGESTNNAEDKLKQLQW